MEKLSTRGRTFVGVVTSDKMSKTVTVEWPRRKYIPKYERYAKARTKVKAHNPEDINAKAGQIVEIMETRPLSKTKKFVVVKVLGMDEDVAIAIKEEEEAKKKKTEKKAAVNKTDSKKSKEDKE